MDRDHDRVAYARIVDAFEDVWTRARPLDSAWVAAYALRVRVRPMPLPPGEVDADVPEPPASPHAVQEAALAALQAARDAGRTRALVVLATGLGKTWLAAFDYAQVWDKGEKRPRLLFVAHRREILRQAAVVFRTLLRDRGSVARVGWFLEDAEELDADLVFASVAKLARPEHRARLAAEPFDYVVVDEVHHATAPSYRNILAAVKPGFLLGLTATPDRADAADIYGLFDDFVAYRADIADGIEVGRLVPFHYHGVRDDIDYANIPWRNRRFDPEALAAAAQTEQRMARTWEAWTTYPGHRTLVFCCSIAHANYVRSWLRGRGVRVAAVYAAPGSDDRDETLAALGRGELDAVCAVDVFNEGVDVPSLDRVVMLRPTESVVVFLQQLGRGLRSAVGKRALTVIDFVGNHRIFLERLRTLLSLGGDRAASRIGALVETGSAELPGGCAVDLELEAKELLERLFRVGGADGVERTYRELRLVRGARPTAGELLRMGAQPKSLRARYGSWLGFVSAEGDLQPDEQLAREGAGAFLDDLETTEMTKSFKMVTLQALIEADALATGLPVDTLAARAWEILRRSPELFVDVPDTQRGPGDTVPDTWTSYWRTNPIAAWTSSARRSWFSVVDGRLVPRFGVAAEAVPALGRLVAELVDWRLAAYRRRRTAEVGFVCRVTWNQRVPILHLPNRATTAVPEGETDVRLPDGAVWSFRFGKEFCNVATPAGVPGNQLPALLRGWFGLHAGEPGTLFDVRFVASPDGLWVEPVQGTVALPGPRRALVAYPDLRAAAGAAQGEREAPEAERVVLPTDLDGDDLFAVRVAGSSMDGGRSPLRDGDWALMRTAPGTSAEAVAGRVALVEVPGEAGSAWQLKRVVREGTGWALGSDNPDGPRFVADASMRVVARLVQAVRPEELGPAAGTVLPVDAVGAWFGIDGWLPETRRQGGHRFVVIDGAGVLVAPDRVRAEGPGRPAETIYVLAQGDGGLRALGVGRWDASEGLWQIPEVDHATWRRWGDGKQVSRTLPDGARGRAQAVADAVLALPETERALVRGGRQGRVLGPASRGGLRIDGGEDGFAERTVSLTDLAWVGVAADDVRKRGGLLDEERCNRLRYLEGTPKGATRWIDTGWALAAWERGEPLVVRAPEPRRPRRADGTAVDATFRVERQGEALTVVIDARGGTQGTSGALNTEYGEGLVLLLERMKAVGLSLADAAVESRATEALPLEERRLQLGDWAYPVEITDVTALKQRMSAAQARVGRAEGAKGTGNSTKRLRLWLTGAGVTAEELAARLEGQAAG